MGTDLFEIEHADAAYALGRDEAEMDPLPTAPFLFLEDEFLARKDDFGHRMDRIDVDLEVEGGFGPVFFEGVDRPGQLGLGPVPDDKDLIDPPARKLTFRDCGISRIETGNFLFLYD